MKIKEIIVEKKQRRRKRSPKYYGIYGYYGGYSGDSSSADSGGEGVEENFADGKIKGKSRPGRVKRSGASCQGSVTDLRARAKKYGGERGRMYHWCANMKSGKKK